MSKGGGGGGGPQEVVQTTSNLPEYARPYFEELLGRTAYETTRPYEAFPGQRIADFTPYEQMGMQGMYDMAAAGAPAQMGMASDIAAQIGYAPSNMGMQIASGFQPMDVTSGYQAGQFDPGYQAGFLGQGYGAGQRGVGYQGTQFDAGYDPGRIAQDYRARGISSYLRPADFESGYTAAPTQGVGDLGQDIREGYNVQYARPGYQAGFLGQGYRPDQLDIDYSAGQFDPGYDASSRQSQFQMPDLTSQFGSAQFDPGYQAGTLEQGYRGQDIGSGYQAGQFDPGYQAQQRDAQFDAERLGVDYQAGQFDPGYVARELGQDYTARELDSQYAGDLDTGPGFKAGTIADAATLEQYMNPYQQLVTDIEKREARRQSEIAESGISQQAAAAGGLGGYREAIMQAERERNLGQQLADIQATGGQRAYEQALQAFEADRGARKHKIKHVRRQSVYASLRLAQQSKPDKRNSRWLLARLRLVKEQNRRRQTLACQHNSRQTRRNKLKSNSVSHLSSKSFSNVSSKNRQDSKPLSLASKRVNVRLKWGLTHNSRKSQRVKHKSSLGSQRLSSLKLLNRQNSSSISSLSKRRRRLDSKPHSLDCQRRSKKRLRVVRQSSLDSQPLILLCRLDRLMSSSLKVHLSLVSRPSNVPLN
jgi:hypothetical protein